MDATTFIKRIQRLHVLQSVTLKFAENGMTGLMRLSGMMRSNPQVYFAHKHEHVVMLAVTQSRRWEGSQNRSYTLYGMCDVDSSWLNEIARDVESIEVAEHGAKALMSGREKMREEGHKQLAESILTKNFLKEMEEWSVTLTHHLTAQDGFPVLTFTLNYSDHNLVSVSIDGWSGRLIFDGMWGDVAYTRPEQVQQTLRSTMEHRLEKLTAA
jgi:hypothetical protein